MKKITIVFAYYMNASMLMRHVETWSSFSDSVKSMLSAIVVDDGSPTKPAVEVLSDIAHPIPIKLFRVEQDIRWNWGACRNIAMHESSGEWHLLTDADHLVSEDLAKALIYGDHDERKVYKFERREHTGEKIKSHSNSYFMTKAMYQKIGGHDESFAGFYGGDGPHRRLVESKAKVITLPDELIRYEYVGDSSTTTYERKTRADLEHRQKVLNARKSGWKPKTLTFAYHEVAL